MKTNLVKKYLLHILNRHYKITKLVIIDVTKKKIIVKLITENHDFYGTLDYAKTKQILEIKIKDLDLFKKDLTLPNAGKEYKTLEHNTEMLSGH